MKTLVAEDTTCSVRSSYPYGSYLDAKERDAIARKQNAKFFDTDEHVDRVVAACAIMKKFFGTNPSYITARGINGRKPFENIKYEHVGTKLSRTPIKTKNKELYAPLLDLGNIQVLSKNGHLTVRVF